jgi:hypothetical protein
MNCRAGARRSQGFGVPDFSFETASFAFLTALLEAASLK